MEMGEDVIRPKKEGKIETEKVTQADQTHYWRYEGR